MPLWRCSSWMNKPISLYFHIPFCRSRCGYCNFYSTTDLTRMDAYTAALCRAVATAPLDGREAVTLYFGGGTPTLLGTRLVAVLQAVRQRLPVAPDAEITLEANPGTVDADSLQALRAAGFNRISFGLQAGQDDALRTLGRSHSAATGVQAVQLARAAGFGNISVDLMLATPGQTVTQVRQLAALAVSLSVQHISAYLLGIEPDTPFGQNGVEADCPDADMAATLYLTLCDELAAAGYQHYEISNFALPGYHSRHNNVYWQLGDYLGIGAAAYSYLDGRRFSFAPDLERFVAAANPWDDRLDDGVGGDVQEYLMLALRLQEGIVLDHAATRYGLDAKKLLARAAPLEREGLLRCHGGSIALTDRGFLLSNSVINYLSEDVC